MSAIRPLHCQKHRPAHIRYSASPPSLAAIPASADRHPPEPHAAARVPVAFFPCSCSACNKTLSKWMDFNCSPVAMDLPRFMAVRHRHGTSHCLNRHSAAKKDAAAPSVQIYRRQNACAPVCSAFCRSGHLSSKHLKSLQYFCRIWTIFTEYPVFIQNIHFFHCGPCRSPDIITAGECFAHSGEERMCSNVS